MAVSSEIVVLVGVEVGNINRRLWRFLIIGLGSLGFTLKAIRDIADFEAEKDLWRKHIWQWYANECPVEETRSRKTLKRQI